MHPHPATGTADKERVVVLDRQVVDRVRLARKQRLAGLRLCPMPRHPLNALQRPRPADNACPNAQAASIQSCPLYRLPTLLSVPLLPTLLDQLCNQPRPAGLVAGTEARPIVPVEVFEVGQQVAPVRVGLELLRATVDRAAAVFTAQEGTSQAAGQLGGDLSEGKMLAGAGGELNRELRA